MIVWVSSDLDARFSFLFFFWQYYALYKMLAYIYTTKAVGIFILGMDIKIIPNNYPICCRPLAVPIA